MNISIMVLIAILVLMALPKTPWFNVKIWQLMLAGAVIVVGSGQLHWRDAVAAIDLKVMGFLTGMFIVGEALVASGYLYFSAYRLVSKLTTVTQLLTAVTLGTAIGSAVLMNDTLAIVGPPLVIRLAREHGINVSLMLLLLAYSITIGSVMSPLGNPQNFLIASYSRLPEPFLVFLGALGVPTLINLGIVFLLLRWKYRSEFSGAIPLVHPPVRLLDRNLARCAQMSMLLLLMLIFVKVVLAKLTPAIYLELSHIALLAALPPLLFSKARWQLLRHLDWRTLVFFASMFVLMASVWQSGVITAQIAGWPVDLHALPVILVASAGISQLISNVPLVALYLPMLGQPEPAALMALAAGSTIAGNFLILGAASNVIIIQHAEKHGATLGFFEFAGLGIPLGLLNLLVYGLWLNYWY